MSFRTAANATRILRFSAGRRICYARDIATAVIAPLCITNGIPRQNRNITSNSHLQRHPTQYTMPLLDPLSAVATAVRQAGIVPDVIPDKAPFTPEALLVVKWPTGKEAILGNTLTTIDTADEPSVSFTPMQSFAAATDVGYTLVMTDPDAPSRSDPRMGQWRHWLVTGLKAPALSALDTGDLSARVTKPATTPYYPPAPPRGTGPHRYGKLDPSHDDRTSLITALSSTPVFLLYQEPSVDFSIPTAAHEYKSASKDRAKWNAAGFADKYGLKLVGVNYVVVRGEE